MRDFYSQAAIKVSRDIGNIFSLCASREAATGWVLDWAAAKSPAHAKCLAILSAEIRTNKQADTESWLLPAGLSEHLIVSSLAGSEWWLLSLECDNTEPLIYYESTSPNTSSCKSLHLQQQISLLMCLLFFCVCSPPLVSIHFFVRQTEETGGAQAARCMQLETHTHIHTRRYKPQTFKWKLTFSMAVWRL